MKRKDGLDDFIRANRDAFDDKEAPDSVWKNIQSTLHSRKSGWWNELMLWRAAAVLFFGMAVYQMIPAQRQSQQQDTATQVTMSEFNDVEAYYIGEISHKVELIESIAPDETADELTPDFQRLEAMYLVLREEMKNRPSKKVKDALVLNLLVRIDLLNQQLHKLEENYNDKDERKKSEI